MPRQNAIRVSAGTSSALLEYMRLNPYLKEGLCTRYCWDNRRGCC